MTPDNMTAWNQNQGSHPELVGLLPAGGKAKRIAPLPCSKELFPVGFQDLRQDRGLRPKVVSHYLSEKMRLASVSKAYMVLRKGKWDIPAYFGVILVRHLKKLASAVKTKTFNRNNEFSRLTRDIVRTDRTDIKRIMVFGDSNSFRPERGKTSWPKLLQDKDPLYLNIFNQSCDGRTTRYDIGERNSINVIGKKLTSHSPLDYVVVMLGTNDVKNKYGPPSPAEIAEGMRQLIEIIENHGGRAKPILLTPPPLGQVTSGELAGAQFRIPSVADEYRLLAMNRDIRLIDIHSILEFSIDLESDMVHLNAIGRRKIANAVWDNMKGKNLRNEQTEESHE